MTNYHMRRKDREIGTADEIASMLKAAKYATLALCRDNEPYIVTLSCGYDNAKNALYFHAATTGLKFEFLNYNPNVCATIIMDKGYVQNECAHEYASLVLRGKVTVVNNLAEKKHGLDILLTHLEEKPEPIFARNIRGNETYNTIAILRLDIAEISGKQGR